MTPFLSGCLIVKNEAQNLSRCLSSIQLYIDELVVVDTGSTDETVAIAEQFGATVHHFEWCDDFAAARNFALEQVHGQWVLMPDADEELINLEPNWTQHLPEAPEIQALKINLRSPTEVTTVLQAIRIFRNRPDLRYEGRYHEHLMLNHQPISQSALVVFDEVQLIHYGYALEILPQKSKQRIPMLERLRQTEGLSYMLLWTLSGMYECAEQWEQAQGCYEEASERLFENLLMGNKPEDFRAVPSWLYGLGENCLKAEDYEGAQLICMRGLEWCPTFPPISYLTGMMLHSLGFDRGAMPYFEACLEFRRTGQFLKTEPFDQRLITVMPQYQLGLLHRELNELERAMDCFTRCLIIDPDFEPAQQQVQEIQSLNRHL